MESGLTQAVLPLVGLAAEKVIRDRYNCARLAAGIPRPGVADTDQWRPRSGPAHRDSGDGLARRVPGRDGDSF
ncbi:MAG: hypothetical protein R6U98_21390 [Pirellulaceae bacterium]